MIVTNKKWDSDTFGYKVGIVTCENQWIDLQSILEQSKEFKLTYIFSDRTLNVVNSQVKHVDTKIIFEKDVNKNPNFDSYVEFDSAIHSYHDLLSLAYLSGVYSRFRLDLNFENNEFEKLYKIWLDNSINGVNNSHIFIETEDKSIVGFVSISEGSKQILKIDLISVLPGLQGKGIASKLIHTVDDFAFKNNYTKIEVATQYSNKPAMYLYNKFGFIIKSKKHIYHIWNK